MLMLWLSLMCQSVAAPTIVVTPTATVVDIDLRQLKGPLVRQLAWSPDRTELYLQTYEANRDASVRVAYHHVIPASGGPLRSVDAPPAWAAAYQQWKSAQASPDDPSWKIDVSVEQKLLSAVSIPGGGDLARGGTVDPTTGHSAETVAGAAAHTGNVSIYTMKLSGEVVGEWINHPIVPGLTFGWAPKGHRFIAFTDKGGRLSFMDRSGRVQRVEGPKDVTLPAWSDDGTHIAYLEKTGRTTYRLTVATIAT